MAGQLTEKLRDCAVIAIIHLFGASYFILFTMHYFVFHFPASPGAIFDSLAILSFCVGILFWCISILFYRTISAAAPHCKATSWQNFEFIATFILICTTTVPYVVLQFPSQHPIQLGYLSVLALTTVGFSVDLLAVDPGDPVASERFPYHCVSLGSLMLVPAIHAFSEKAFFLSPLTINFTRVILFNSLFALCFLLRPLERMGLITGWKPSLYAMHLGIVCSAVAWSREILHHVTSSWCWLSFFVYLRWRLSFLRIKMLTLGKYPLNVFRAPLQILLAQTENNFFSVSQ